MTDPQQKNVTHTQEQHDPKPGANPNIPSDLDDPRNHKSKHPAEPTEQHNQIIRQPRKE